MLLGNGTRPPKVQLSILVDIEAIVAERVGSRNGKISTCLDTTALGQVAFGQ